MDSFLHFSCEYFLSCFCKYATLSRCTITIKAISECAFETFGNDKHATINRYFTTRYELKSMVSTSILMYTWPYSISFLKDDFRFTNTRYHEMSISFYGKYDSYSFLIGTSKIWEKMIIFFCYKRKVSIFFTMLPSSRRYSFKEVVFYDTRDTFSCWSNNTNNCNIRLRMKYMRPYRGSRLRMLIAYDVSRYERCHCEIL